MLKRSSVSTIAAAAALMVPSAAAAATWYVDGASGDDGNDGTAPASAKRCITAGVAAMSSGDTLVIADGNYDVSTDCHRIRDVPSGQAGAYSIIRAASDFGVTMTSNFDVSPVELIDRSYVEIHGINVAFVPLNGFDVSDSDHIKLVRCSVMETDGPSYGFGIRGSEYVLVEECHAWGTGRYQFGVGSSPPSRYVVFRRNVARWDRLNATEPHACFAAYHQADIVFQNNIAIDGQANYGPGADGISPGERFARAFFTPNGHTDVHFVGNLVLNFEGVGLMYEGSVDFTGAVVRNNVIWDVSHPPTTTSSLVFLLSDDQSATIEHNTFGGSVTQRALSSSFDGQGSTVRSSLLVDLETTEIDRAVRNFATDGNAFWNNRPSNFGAGSPGPNDLCTENGNAIDPLTGTPGNGTVALRHLVRIEDGSDLDGAAQDGGDIGAEMLFAIGRPGTLYGEEGWDEVTSQSLWPFANEQVIRSHFCSYDLHGIDGNRGFCASPSLTHYVWDYLGHGCPLCSPEPGPDGGVGGSGVGGAGVGGTGADPGAAPAGDDGGCGCRLTPPPAGPRASWLACLAALGLWQRRRRRHR